MYINRTQRIPGSEPSLKQLRKRSGDASSSQSFASILEVDVVEIGDPEQKEKGHQERGNRDHLEESIDDHGSDDHGSDDHGSDDHDSDVGRQTASTNTSIAVNSDIAKVNKSLSNPTGLGLDVKV